jgi:hypothetical protein
MMIIGTYNIIYDKEIANIPVFSIMKIILLLCIILMTYHLPKFIQDHPKLLTNFTIVLYLLLSITIQVQMNFLSNFITINLLKLQAMHF